MVKTDKEIRDRKNTSDNKASTERVEPAKEQLTTAKAIQNLSKNIQDRGQRRQIYSSAR